MIHKILNLWFKLHQSLRYLLVGGYNTVFAYSTFAVSYYFLQNYLSYNTILFIIYILSVPIAFFLLRFFVFRSTSSIKKELPKTYFTYIFIYFLNALLLYLFVNVVKVTPYIGQLFCTFIIPCITYFILKHFSFKKS